jgi:hypothetical protein
VELFGLKRGQYQLCRVRYRTGFRKRDNNCGVQHSSGSGNAEGERRRGESGFDHDLSDRDINSDPLESAVHGNRQL